MGVEAIIYAFAIGAVVGLLQRVVSEVFERR